MQFIGLSEPVQSWETVMPALCGLSVCLSDCLAVRLPDETQSPYRFWVIPHRTLLALLL